MNRTLALFFSGILVLPLLTSCETTSGGSSGEEIINPTVAEVERIDRQMGLEPRRARTRDRYDDYYTAPTPAPAPVVKPAPELAPQPAPEATTPPPQPSVDAETLQKLR